MNLKGIQEIGSFYNSPRVKQLFYSFQIHSADFKIFRRISVARHFLVSLTSIVGNKKYTMEVNETKNCLATDIPQM